MKCLAEYLGLDDRNLALVPNATMAINTVLRSIPWDFKNDTVLIHTTTYGACSNTVKFLHDYYGLQFDITNTTYPIEDNILLARFEEKLSSGTYKLCMFDMISSMPGVTLPYEKLIQLCHKYNVWTLVDGAHAVGLVDLKFIDELKPDFLTTNLHKWLSVPKSCALLYINPKHHSLVQTNPFSWSYVPKELEDSVEIDNNTLLIEKFWYLGTVSYGPIICIEEAISFRKNICGGEQAIRGYQNELQEKAIPLIIAAFGPGAELLENSTNTYHTPGMFNISFPIEEAHRPVLNYLLESFVSFRKFKAACEARMIKEYRAFAPFLVHNGRIWVRFSVNVFNEESDYSRSAVLIKKCLDECLEEKLNTLKVEDIKFLSI